MLIQLNLWTNLALIYEGSLHNNLYHSPCLLEDAGVDEIAEGLVVKVVAGEFGVLGHHVDDYLEEVGVALNLGSVAVGVVDGVDESFALGEQVRELLDLGTDCIGVLPFNAAI